MYLPVFVLPWNSFSHSPNYRYFLVFSISKFINFIFSQNLRGIILITVFLNTFHRSTFFELLSQCFLYLWILFKLGTNILTLRFSQFSFPLRYRTCKFSNNIILSMFVSFHTFMKVISLRIWMFMHLSENRRYKNLQSTCNIQKHIKYSNYNTSYNI